MAKVTGPLLSMDASGTVAGTAVFSKWKGRNYVRTRVIPHNPKSAAQTGVRTTHAGLVATFQANVATINTNFATRAKQRSISPFNAFVGFNQKRMAEGFYPANSVTPTNAAPSNNATALAAAVSGKYVRLTWVDSADANGWLFAIYRKLGSAPTGLSTEQVGMIKRGAQVFEDGPLTAGTWYYCIAAISVNGGRTSLLAAITAVVT